MSNGSGGSAAALGCVPTTSKVSETVQCGRIHSVKVELRFKDDRSPVPVEECHILQGDATINSGPLATGVLESKNLPAAAYTVTFPDLDANEWAEG